MSEIKFLALSDKELTKTEYQYRDVLPNILPGEMSFNGKISFSKELSSSEKRTLSDVFNDFHVYAIHSDLGLCYETRYKHVLSYQTAKDMFEEMTWLKAFIKKQLKRNTMVMLLTLDLGYPTDRFSIKTKYVEIDDWNLDETQDIHFEYGIVYEFVDNNK